MICLGIESSGEAAGAALVDETGVLGEIRLNMARRHSMVLAPMVRDLLAYAGLELKDLGCIAVNIGPGSFTGLRIGISLAASLAYGAELPTVGVSSLETLYDAGIRLAEEAEAGRETIILPMIPIKRNEAYVMHHGEARMVQLDKFIHTLSTQPRYLIMGEGWADYEELFRGADLKLLKIGETDRRQRPSSVARLGLEAALRGGAGDAFSLAPNYIRRPEAELNLERKLKRHD